MLRPHADLLWNFAWETEYGCNIATPIVAGNYVFISTGYNRGSAVKKGGSEFRIVLRRR